MTERNTHDTIVKLATELMIDGLTVSEALRALAIVPKYAAHMGNNLFSDASDKIAQELLRRKPQAAA